jgi:hypothetical protein
MRDESKVDFPVGPGVDMIPPMPADRVGDPGVGLDDVGHRVLTYRDMVSLRLQLTRPVPPGPPRSEPERRGPRSGSRSTFR